MLYYRKGIGIIAYFLIIPIQYNAILYLLPIHSTAASLCQTITISFILSANLIVQQLRSIIKSVIGKHQAPTPPEKEKRLDPMFRYPDVFETTQIDLLIGNNIQPGTIRFWVKL